MDVVVLGGTGVVGRPLLPLLSAAGHAVRAVARSPEAAARVEASGCRAVPPPDDLAAALRGADAVVDLRTSVPPLLRAAPRRAWREHDRLRDEGTAQVVAAAEAAGVGRLVRDSVAFLHADGGDALLDEDAPLDPGEHLASSLAGEQHVRGFSGDGVVLRFALLYGPLSSHSRAAVRLGRRLHVTPVLGPPEAWAPGLHHDDAASAVLAALTGPAGTWLVADEPLRRRDLVEAQRVALGVRRLRVAPAALGRGETARSQTRSLRLDAGRFRRATGWAPSWPSQREGWADLVRAVQAG